jgi:hypothetical protein
MPDLRALGPVTEPQSLGLGGAARPKWLGSAPLPHPINLGQKPFQALSFFSLEGDARPKLITTMIIDFTLQIKSIFLIIIIFILNLITLMNLIILIIFNLFGPSSYSF